MAVLAASNWTITIDAKYGQRRDERGRLIVTGTAAIGNGVDTYPTGGIPLPAIGVFGMRVSMQEFNIFGLNGLTTDYMTRYDQVNHKVQLFEEEAVAAGGPLLEADAGEVVAARTWRFHAEGW